MPSEVAAQAAVRDLGEADVAQHLADAPARQPAGLG
jgi:hypothetical protein